MKEQNEIAYIESILRALISELKQRKCLSQEFQFLTKADRERMLENCIDAFIRNY